MRRWLLLFLALTLCLAEGRLWSRSRPVFVMSREAMPAPTPAAPVDPRLATLTPDDLARGIWDFRNKGIPSEQAAALRGPLEQGAQLRRRIEELRVQRAETRRLWLEDGGAIAELLGGERVKKLGRIQ